jgi:hypothetical protein
VGGVRQPHARRVPPAEPPRESLASTLLALAGVFLFGLAVVLVWAGLG